MRVHSLIFLACVCTMAFPTSIDENALLETILESEEGFILRLFFAIFYGQTAIHFVPELFGRSTFFVNYRINRFKISFSENIEELTLTQNLQLDAACQENLLSPTSEANVYSVKAENTDYLCSVYDMKIKTKPGQKCVIILEHTHANLDDVLFVMCDDEEFQKIFKIEYLDYLKKSPSLMNDIDINYWGDAE